MIVSIGGVQYDCEFTIEEHGYPSNGWDDAGQGTIVSLISVNGLGLDLLEQSLIEKLEEQVAYEIDSDPHYFDSDMP